MNVRPIWAVAQGTMGRGGRYWEIWFETPRGSMVYGFPVGTLEQRVAEYDLDPEDVDGVLDMVMYEPLIPHPLNPSNFESDPVYRAGKRAKLKRDMPGFVAGTEVPPTLYTADTLEEAREAHWIRVGEVKKNYQYIPHEKADPKDFPQLAAKRQQRSGFVGKAMVARDGDPLDLIRENHAITEQGVEEKRKGVTRLRKIYQGQPLESKPTVPVEKGFARRTMAMVEDKGNPEITVAPGWVTLALSQE